MSQPWQGDFTCKQTHDAPGSLHAIVSSVERSCLNETGPQWFTVRMPAGVCWVRCQMSVLFGLWTSVKNDPPPASLSAWHWFSTTISFDCLYFCWSFVLFFFFFFLFLLFSFFVCFVLFLFCFFVSSRYLLYLIYCWLGQMVRAPYFFVLFPTISKWAHHLFAASFLRSS